MPRKKKKENNMKKIPVEVLRWMGRDMARLEESVRNDITPAVVASFGFIIALVWRDAIAAALERFLENAGLTEKAYLYNFISAAIITVIVIGIMIVVTKYGRRKRKKRVENKAKRRVKELEEAAE